MRSCSTCCQDFSTRPVPVPAVADVRARAVAARGLGPLQPGLTALEVVGLELGLGSGPDPQQLDARAAVPTLGSQHENHPGTAGTCSSASRTRSKFDRAGHPFSATCAPCTRLHNHRTGRLACRVSDANAAAAVAAAAAPVGPDLGRRPPTELVKLPELEL